MRPSESFLSQHVRALQTMLRVIAMDDNRVSPVVPDGIYGYQTMDAVREFQASRELPATGVTNLETWERIVAAYEPAVVNQGPAQPIIVSIDRSIHSGESSPAIMLAQSMLHTIGNRFHCIDLPSLSGTLDPQTERSLRAFQTISALPSTGELDKMTWKHLSLQFSLAAVPGRDRDYC